MKQDRKVERHRNAKKYYTDIESFGMTKSYYGCLLFENSQLPVCVVGRNALENAKNARAIEYNTGDIRYEQVIRDDFHAVCSGFD